MVKGAEFNDNILGPRVQGVGLKGQGSVYRVRV
jgi:hypothetical protein